MKPYPGSLRLHLFLGLVIAATFVGPRARAAATGGIIEGRVLNIATGAYLENARVSVEGSTRAAFTNNVGEYRLADVPAGVVTLRVFFTGLAPQTTTLDVTAGR